MIGLGNPGSEYKETKHNLGYMVIDRIAQRKRTTLKPGSGPYWESKDGTGSFLLIKPTTSMNESGVAVLALKDKYDFSPSDILVIYDDLDLPLGSVRIREKGGAGGHHGMESIIYHLRSEDFPRIRLGIDSVERDSDDVEFVLSRFSEDQVGDIRNMVDYAADGALEFVYRNIQRSMNKFNKRENEGNLNREEN